MSKKDVLLLFILKSPSCQHLEFFVSVSLSLPSAQLKGKRKKKNNSN